LPFTTSAAAARAAVSAAAGFGIGCTDPVILADGANVIVHLTPSPVVGKGAPAMPPSAEVPATAPRADGHVMSFWTYLPRASTSAPDAATLGSMLRDLHVVLRPYPGAAPWLAPLGDIEAFLARPRTGVSEADAEALADAFQRLTGQLDPALDQGQVLHGDAGAGNLMATGAGWVWHDFEDVCSGPIAWDLAPSVASQFMDGSPGPPPPRG